MNLAESRSHIPIPVPVREKKAKRGIRPVSKRRSKELREYSKKRKEFLAAHPWCQWWLRQEEFNGEGALSEEYAIKHGGLFRINSIPSQCPPATEIHHMNKRRGAMLNDERYWMAVSAEGHAWIENNKKLARERGYLLNF